MYTEKKYRMLTFKEGLLRAEAVFPDSFAFCKVTRVSYVFGAFITRPTSEEATLRRPLDIQDFKDIHFQNVCLFSIRFLVNSETGDAKENVPASKCSSMFSFRVVCNH